MIAKNRTQYYRITSGLMPWFFITPSVILHVVFVVYPMVQTGVISLYKWDGVNPIKTFIGFGNYIEIIHSPVFWRSLMNNFIWIVWHLALPMTAGLFLAILVGQVRNGQVIYRAIFFMPAVLSMVVVGIVWGQIYNPRFGLLNAVLRSLNLSSLQHAWLGEPATALLSIMLASSWLWYGYCFVLFLAGLQQINPTLYDAAKIDGANGWQTIRYVTIPGLRNVSTVVSIWTLMAGLKVFDIILVMTAGGPGYCTQTLANWTYQVAIGSGIYAGNQVGLGCAIAYCLGAMVVTAAIATLRVRERAE